MIALRLFIVLTFITGILYPVTVTGVSHLFFKQQANGSILYEQGRAVGSKLIAQKFKSTSYFWPRPSAVDYNPLPSGGSNLSPSSKKFNKEALASGSGLDPDITAAAAYAQIDRIVDSRHFNETQKQQVMHLVTRHIQHPDLGILGVDRVNVLLLNMALDRLH